LHLIQAFVRHCLGTMEKERGYAIVAESEGRAMGFGLLTRWTTGGEISDLIVAENLRGQGIGTAMIAELTQAALALHMPALEIGAAHSNPRAAALYHRLGFRPDRTLMLNLGNGLEPVTYMVKVLDGA